MGAADWLVALVPIAAVLWLGWRVRGKARDVAGYLVAGRSAGRYLVTVAGGMAAFGLASLLAGLEFTYTSGFAVGFWGAVAVPVSALMALTGFAVYRFRETRALTLGQFLEMRYSRGVRVAAAALGWVAGVAGYAIFPAVSARFVVAYGGLPREFVLAGVALPAHGLLAAVFLATAVVVVIGGGQIAALVTDCAQGIFVYVGAAVVVVAVLAGFSFTQFREVLLARPPGSSFTNPFETGDLTEFNILFVLLGIFGGVYNRLSQPSAQAGHASAASPHEQKMAVLLASWRSGLLFTMVMLLGLAAYTWMHHPDFAAASASLQGTEDYLTLAVRAVLPGGVAGIFLAVMLFLMLSTDTSQLHALGTTVIQDLVLPFRKRPLATRTHLALLRMAIALVAVLAWCVALVFDQKALLYMVMALVGSLYLGFAGALLLGGLYWSRGTSAGAAAAMAVGAVFAVASFSLTWHWEPFYHPLLAAQAPGFLEWASAALDHLGRAVPIAAWELSPERFPISGAELAFLNSLVCIAVYGAVSLATCRRPFDMDRMLRRGVHALRRDEGGRGTVVEERARPLWQKLTGLDAQCSRGDRWLAGSVVAWSLLATGVFAVVAAWNLLVGRWSDEAFVDFWQYWTIGSSLFIGSITGAWFAVGAFRDLVRFLGRLDRLADDPADDGRVRREEAEVEGEARKV